VGPALWLGFLWYVTALVTRLDQFKRKKKKKKNSVKDFIIILSGCVCVYICERERKNVLKKVDTAFLTNWIPWWIGTHFCFVSFIYSFYFDRTNRSDYTICVLLRRVIFYF
jgi:hypothetical protein